MSDKILYWSPDEGLTHHGIAGQKWGQQNGPPYPLGYEDHSAVEKRLNKYSNIDGSVNEKGIDHKDKFIKKQIKKNEKSYDKYIKKYQKLADKNADNKEERDKYLARKANAEKTKQSVNEYIKNMSMDDVLNVEERNRQETMKLLKEIGTGAATGAGIGLAVGAGLAVPSLIRSGASTAASFLSKVDPNTAMESIYKMAETPQGKQAMKYVDTGIRTYADMRAYTFSIAADQAMNRMQQQGTLDKASNLLSSTTSKTINNTYNSVSGNTYNDIARYAKLGDRYITKYRG